MNFTLYLDDTHIMLGMFLGPKALKLNMFGYDVLWYYKPKKNQACKKAMDLGGNITNTLKLAMLHNNVFEKLYNSFNENKSWLWIIVTISLGLQIFIVFVVHASFHLLVASIACYSIFYNVIFFNVHSAYKEWIKFVIF